MKNILIINDFSPEAEHATEFALFLAGKINANLYIWNTLEPSTKPVHTELVLVGPNEMVLDIPVNKNGWLEKLESKLNWETSLRPAVHFIEGIEFISDNTLSIVKQHDIGLLVKGIAANGDNLSNIDANILKCSTKSGCPLLIVPEKFLYKTFQKIVYATDLRFCRQEVIGFLSKFAKLLNASILVANIPAKGLPHMDDQYAVSIFNDEIVHSLNNEHIYFSNIKERNIPKALDVLVNGMNNDLLVLVNHKYHFTEFLGHSIPYTIPANIQVPLLIFPS